MSEDPLDRACLPAAALLSDKMTATHSQMINIKTESLGAISVQVESCRSLAGPSELRPTPLTLTHVFPVTAPATPDSSKPTLILLHSFSTSTKLYSCVDLA